MLNIALAIRFLEKNKIDSNIQYALMAGRAYQSTRGNDNLFPEGNQDTTFLSKASHSQNHRDGCPRSDLLLSHNLSNNNFHPHHYLSFFHTRHPINTSITTTPGSQTQ